jgi:hypothetical protein
MLTLICISLVSVSSGAFGKLLNVTISFVMAARPPARLSVSPHGMIQLTLGGFL